MKRRIFAWVLLAGFLLLFLNVFIFKFYWQLSMTIYLIVAFAFLMYNGRAQRMQEAEKIFGKGEKKPGDPDSSTESNSEGSSENSSNNR